MAATLHPTLLEFEEGRHGLLGDLPFFLCPNDQNFDKTLIGLDFQDLFAGFLVFIVVHRDSETFETLAASSPDGGGILSDAAGEDNGIQTSQHCEVGPDIFLDAVAGDLQGQFGKRFPKVRHPENLTHVVGAANPLQSTFFVQKRLEIFLRYAGCPSQIERYRRVQIPATSPHDQPLQGGMPMEVSTLRPCWIAAALAPLPR